MNEKEKAKYLVDKFSRVGLQQRNEGIACALICVDEMINYHNSLFNKGFKDIHIALSSPIKTYSDILNPALNNLQQVKLEIQKL